MKMLWRTAPLWELLRNVVEVISRNARELVVSMLRKTPMDKLLSVKEIVSS